MEAENISYEESEAKQRVRCKFMKLSPKIQKSMSSVASAVSPEGMEKWVASLDLQSLTDDDIRELFYALGPVSIGRILERTIPLVQSDTDLEAVAAIAVLRHVIFTPLKK